MSKLDAVTRAKLIENNGKNVERIQTALKQTLQELAFLETEEAKSPGTYTAALTNLRLKRDRQHANAKATQAYITLLKKEP